VTPLKERLLVLAKATPEISKKYKELICVAGITDKGEWRRIYPVPWEVFWEGRATKFKKKHWIEYELEDESPSDHRPESRKIKHETIKLLGEAKFSEIEGLLKGKLSTIENLEQLGPKVQSLGVVRPVKIKDFQAVDNEHYEELLRMKSQTTLDGNSAIRIDIPRYKYKYTFADDLEGREHNIICEDWEVSELHRNCEKYRAQGKYRDEKEVQEKVKERMLLILQNDRAYFIVGTHFRFPTFLVVGVVYPRKADLSS